MITKHLILFIFFSGLSLAQSRTNLETFYFLIDSSIAAMPAGITPSTVSVYTGNNSLLYNYILGKMNEKYPGIKTAENGQLSYAVEDINLKYSGLFRKKFLGDYYLERTFILKGSYYLTEGNKGERFNYNFTDTIKYDDLRLAENQMHPFTRADVPTEPLFQGIIEPVIAIGTAAAAVVLFFILRSK